MIAQKFYIIGITVNKQNDYRPRVKIRFISNKINVKNFQNL